MSDFDTITLSLRERALFAHYDDEECQTIGLQETAITHTQDLLGFAPQRFEEPDLAERTIAFWIDDYKFRFRVITTETDSKSNQGIEGIHEQDEYQLAFWNGVGYVTIRNLSDLGLSIKLKEERDNRPVHTNHGLLAPKNIVKGEE